MKKYGMKMSQIISRNIILSIVCFAIFAAEVKLLGIAVSPYIAGAVGVVVVQLAFFLIFKGNDEEK